MRKKFIPQLNRVFRRVQIVDHTSSEVLRPAQRHHDLRRANVVDGVSSSTGLYDDAVGDVPEVFNPNIDRLELADMLMRRGMSPTKSSDVAADGVKVEN